MTLDPDPPSFKFELGTHFNLIEANTRTFSISNSEDGDLKEKDEGYYERRIFIDSNGGIYESKISLDLFYNRPFIPP